MTRKSVVEQQIDQALNGETLTYGQLKAAVDVYDKNSSGWTKGIVRGLVPFILLLISLPYYLLATLLGRKNLLTRIISIPYHLIAALTGQSSILRHESLLTRNFWIYGKPTSIDELEQFLKGKDAGKTLDETGMTEALLAINEVMMHREERTPTKYRHANATSAIMLNHLHTLLSKKTGVEEKTLSFALKLFSNPDMKLHPNKGGYEGDPDFVAITPEEKTRVFNAVVAYITGDSALLNQDHDTLQPNIPEGMADVRFISKKVRSYAEVFDPNGKFTDTTMTIAKTHIRKLEKLIIILSKRENYQKNFCNVNALLYIIDGKWSIPYGTQNDYLIASIVNPYIYLHNNSLTGNATAGLRRAKYAIIRSLIEKSASIYDHLITLADDTAEKNDIIRSIIQSNCLQAYGFYLDEHLETIRSKKESIYLQSPDTLLQHFFTDMLPNAPQELGLQEENTTVETILAYARQQHVGTKLFFEYACFDETKKPTGKVTESMFIDMARETYGYDHDTVQAAARNGSAAAFVAVPSRQAMPARRQ
jgi:hypothetical protein